VIIDILSGISRGEAGASGNVFQNIFDIQTFMILYPDYVDTKQMLLYHFYAVGVCVLLANRGKGIISVCFSTCLNGLSMLVMLSVPMGKISYSVTIILTLVRAIMESSRYS
jgi:hypothetical protein